MTNNNNSDKPGKKNWITISLHILIWLMIFISPYIFNRNPENNLSVHEDRDQNNFLFLNTVLNFIWVGIFYFNSGILIPRLVYKRKIFLYVCILLAAYSVAILADGLLFHVLNISHRFSIYNSVKHNFIPFVFTVAVSAAYKTITDKTKTDLWISDLQSQNLKSELSFLRSQMSPHFLLNVMNNITAMIRLKSVDLEPSVMKLSSLMQYMLYETDEDKVVLKSEAEYLKAYIDLQHQRFGDELILNVAFNIKEDWHAIEPMLLIPFVENAFKHGGQLQQPEIHISLSAENNELYFTVINKFEDSQAIKDKTSGIGLANVRRRLELLYPGKHVLNIENQHGYFTIKLQITLS
jgi:two-component system, LytTR family, sensor kinase